MMKSTLIPKWTRAWSGGSGGHQTPFSEWWDNLPPTVQKTARRQHHLCSWGYCHQSGTELLPTHGPSPSRCSGLLWLNVLFASHKARTIVSWPNPKQWLYDSYFRFDDGDKIKYTFSRPSKENRVSWRHTAPGQNGLHFADGIFRYIFVNENADPINWHTYAETRGDELKKRWFRELS